MHYLILALALLLAGPALAQQTGDPCDPTVQAPVVHLKGEKGVSTVKARICPAADYELVEIDITVEGATASAAFPGEYQDRELFLVDITTPCGTSGSAKLRGFTTAAGYSEDREVATLTFRPCAPSMP